jgi:20S proteasome alpha/beta subunit
MTVGIASIGDKGNAIIFAADQMMSVGIRTADLPLVVKGFLIHKHWFTVYAGSVTAVPPILSKVKKALAASPDADIAEVAGTFVQVYREERQKLAEQSVLSPFGLDMQSFVNLISTNQSAELTDMKRKIQDFDFDCEFLVGGFGPDKRAHIFSVTPPGVESHYDSIGFWSIGSGAEAALSSLLFRRLHPVLSVKETLYFVAEAKFMSECAMGVGKNSIFFLVTAEGESKIVLVQDVEPLRQLWETEGQAPIPTNLEERVPGFRNLSEVIKELTP